MRQRYGCGCHARVPFGQFLLDSNFELTRETMKTKICTLTASSFLLAAFARQTQVTTFTSTSDSFQISVPAANFKLIGVQER
jgi:uncharacterized lipoprotein YajG